MKIIRKAPWFEDTDGVAAIYKDPDSKPYYEITIRMKGTSLTAGPTWKTNGVGILDESYSISGHDLTMKIKVSGTGEASVKFSDNLGNDEDEPIRFKYRDR